MKFFNGKLVLMTEKGLQSCNHLTWQQSIYDFQKKATSVRMTKQLGEASEDDEDDLVSIFLRALEIYKGRVKGYMGLVDNAYMRENFLRAEIKLLLKEVIQQSIEDAAQQHKNQEALKIFGEAENDKDRDQKFTKIVRIAIEFSVELKDCDFLF